MSEDINFPNFSIDDVDALRAKIFSADDISAEIVSIIEWDGMELEVRSMTGFERAEYLAHMQSLAPNGDMTKVDWKGLYPSLLAATVFAPARDENGTWIPKASDRKVFTTADVELINAKSARVIEKLARKAQELSGLNETDED